MNGTLELTFDKHGKAGATRIARLHQAAPLRALFPETCRMDLPVAALTATCGGFTGGDSMTTRIEIGESAAAMVVAQAAEKLYRAKDGETRIDIDLRVDAGGWLEWLPQETILFDGARMRRNNRIALDGDAGLLAGEILVFGRAARGERMNRGLVHDGWSIRRDGTLAWADRFHAEDDMLAAALEHPAALAGVRAAAMLIHAGRDAPVRLPLVREVMDAEPPGLRCAATVVNGVLIARWLALDALDLRPSFAAAWTVLRNAHGLAPHLPTFWSH
jgi:urease accessory protein